MLPPESPSARAPSADAAPCCGPLLPVLCCSGLAVSSPAGSRACGRGTSCARSLGGREASVALASAPLKHFSQACPRSLLLRDWLCILSRLPQTQGQDQDSPLPPRQPVGSFRFAERWSILTAASTREQSYVRLEAAFLEMGNGAAATISSVSSCPVSGSSLLE